MNKFTGLTPEQIVIANEAYRASQAADEAKRLANKMTPQRAANEYRIWAEEAAAKAATYRTQAAALQISNPDGAALAAEEAKEFADASQSFAERAAEEAAKTEEGTDAAYHARESAQAAQLAADFAKRDAAIAGETARIAKIQAQLKTQPKAAPVKIEITLTAMTVEEVSLDAGTITQEEIDAAAFEYDVQSAALASFYDAKALAEKEERDARREELSAAPALTWTEIDNSSDCEIIPVTGPTMEQIAGHLFYVRDLASNFNATAQRAPLEFVLDCPRLPGIDAVIKSAFDDAQIAHRAANCLESLWRLYPSSHYQRASAARDHAVAAALRVYQIAVCSYCNVAGPDQLREEITREKNSALDCLRLSLEIQEQYNATMIACASAARDFLAAPTTF